jgi:hypothetical protein
MHVYDPLKLCHSTRFSVLKAVAPTAAAIWLAAAAAAALGLLSIINQRLLNSGDATGCYKEVGNRERERERERGRGRVISKHRIPCTDYSTHFEPLCICKGAASRQVHPNNPIFHRDITHKMAGEGDSFKMSRITKSRKMYFQINNKISCAVKSIKLNWIWQTRPCGQGPFAKTVYFSQKSARAKKCAKWPQTQTIAAITLCLCFLRSFPGARTFLLRLDTCAPI